MNLFDKINAFERLCNKLVSQAQDGVVPLSDLSENVQLRIDPNTGRAYYEATEEQPKTSIPKPSLSGPSSISKAPGQAPAPPAQAKPVPVPAKQQIRQQVPAKKRIAPKPAPIKFDPYFGATPVAGPIVNPQAPKK